MKFLNANKDCVIRLMTPLRLRYEVAYAKAFPFDKIVEGMLNPQMVKETVQIMRLAVEEGVNANVIINNRSGGNAPMIARMVAEE